MVTFLQCERHQISLITLKFLEMLLMEDPLLIQIDKFKRAEVCKKTYGMYVYVV